MARRPRLEVAPGMYHVTARGNRRQPIALARSDVSQLLALVGGMVKRHRWRVYSYCVMPNHYHLLVETVSPTLGDGMREVNGRYARWFNRRYGFGGHLFQGRFHSAAVDSESHLLELSRYVVLNPVRAGICRRAEDWPFSSYRASVGLAPVASFLQPDDLVRHFGPSREKARKRYAAFVAEGVRAPRLAAEGGAAPDGMAGLA